MALQVPSTAAGAGASPPPRPYFKEVLAVSAAAGRQYANRFSGRILPSYDEQVAKTLGSKAQNPLIYRLPGEGDDAALLLGYRQAMMKLDPAAATAWGKQFSAYQAYKADPAGKAVVSPYPLGVILGNRVNVLAPIAYGEGTREYWDHQYDFTFRIQETKNPDELVPDTTPESEGGAWGGWNPVKLRQALPRTHPSLFLTKIIYGNPADPTEGSAHAMLCIFFPRELTGDGNVLDIVSTYPLTGAEQKGFGQVVQARTMFQDRDLIALTRGEKDAMFSATKTPPAALTPLFVNDVTQQLAGRRGDPYNLQEEDPRTGHCFAWMCAIAKNLVKEAPESYWRGSLKERMNFYGKYLYPYLSERHTGDAAIEMWRDVRAFIASGFSAGGRRRKTFRKKRRGSRKTRKISQK